MPAADALLVADRQARSDALDVSRSFIVQAPAGSGKTELLIQRYLHLLAVVSEPEEVVAITFTRKAAAEMQLRVLRALQQAAAGTVPDAPHERLTLAAAHSVLQRDREGHWSLLESPRRMRIQTLDAFCASVARLLPVSSGLGGLLTTLADAGMTRLYREAAAATLDWLEQADERGRAVRQVLVHLDNNTADYIDYLSRMLATRDQWQPFVGAGRPERADDVRCELEAILSAQIETILVCSAGALRAAADNELLHLARYAGAQIEAATGQPHPLVLLDPARWPATNARDLPTWRSLCSLLLTQSGSIRKSVNRNNGFPPGDDGQKQRFAVLLQGLQDTGGLARDLARISALPDPAYSDEQWQMLMALFTVLPVAVAELTRLFAERGITDHVEVAQAADRALGDVDRPGDAAMLLDYRIRHLLVDEMQDTSIGQYRLLERLTAGWAPGDGRTLFCVGDPMQSIYRFRNAEVGQFVAARQNGIGNVALESLVLRQNFRSGENLVHWFNTVFAQVLPARDDIASGAISYSESVPVPALAGRGDVQVYPLFGASAAAEAQCTFDVVRDCLAQHTQDNVAVLVRSRTQLPLLLAALRNASVSYQAVEIDRLTDLPEVIDVLTLTRALCHHDDRIAWLALLRGPWAGMSWADLHALVVNDSTSAVSDLMQDTSRLASLTEAGRLRLAAFTARLAGYLTAHGARSLRERIECAWLALGGAASLQDADQLENVYRYFDVLERMETAGTLADVAELEHRLDDERVSTHGDANCRLQVMTMHRAKGLQFDHVVLHGLGRYSGRVDKAVLNWLNVTTAEGESRLILSPLGPRAELEKDPLYRFIEDAARASDRIELDRLLYVACTRARQSLHLVGSVPGDPAGDGPGTPDSRSLLSRLWGVLAVDFERASATTTAVAAEDENTDNLLVHPTARRFDTEWQVAQLPDAPGRASFLDRQLMEREVDFRWVGSAARHAGTIVHRWMQILTEADGTATALPVNCEAASKRWAVALGVAADEVDAVWQRVHRSLENILADARGRWLLSGEGHAELRLTAVSDGKLESIVIDRVRIDDGRHWIVDYKTGSHEGGDLDTFLTQEAERYRPQLQRYRRIYGQYANVPVRTALYFPLLQRFVELEFEPEPAGL